jgi:tetratricopeptide (TPR) repeat protein
MGTGESNIREAVDRDPTSMDVHRIYGYMFESIGNYGQAIEQYKDAIHINPNLTFIYLRIGANYRTLKITIWRWSISTKRPRSMNNWA